MHRDTSTEKVILAYVKANGDAIIPEVCFSYGMHTFELFGNGCLELAIHGNDEFEWTRPLLLQSYKAS